MWVDTKGDSRRSTSQFTFVFLIKFFLSYFTGGINKHDKQLFRRLKAQHSLFKSKSISNKKKPLPHSPYLACWFFNQWLVKFSFWLSQIIGLSVRQNVLTYWSVCDWTCPNLPVLVYTVHPSSEPCRERSCAATMEKTLEAVHDGTPPLT